MSLPNRKPTARVKSPSISSLHAIYSGSSSIGLSGTANASINQHENHSTTATRLPPSPLTPSSSYNRLFPERGSWANANVGSSKEFEETQNKTFCKWGPNHVSLSQHDTIHTLQAASHYEARARLSQAENTKNKLTLCMARLNTRLEPLGYAPLSDLGRDFQDGTRLIQLVEILTGEPLGRYNKAPVMRVQKAENVIKALETIKRMGVHLTNIGPEDIMDGNRKLILGMIWLLVLRFLIADISEEGTHAKEGLLLWCQRRTAKYAEVDVQNFSRSWQDGLAFCALIHCHRPDLLDYNALSKNLSDAAANTELAFKIAEEHLGVPRLLDVEDVVYARRPDEKSIMTYVAQFFHAFSNTAKEETEARIITNFVEHMRSIMVAIHDYERRANALLEAIIALIDNWNAHPPSAPYARLKKCQSDFLEHKSIRKRSWLKEKADVTALLANIQTKLKTYGLRAYVPPPGLQVEHLAQHWTNLLSSEAVRSKTINAGIRQIKEQLRLQFAQLANEFESQLQRISLQLASIDGPLERQLDAIAALEDKVDLLRTSLPAIQGSESECVECNVEENDYTVYTYDDLSFELDQVSHDILGRRLFVENQIVARSVTNVTPEQLEEYESTFRAFDKDQSNTLNRDELQGALNSLGVMVDSPSDSSSEATDDEITFEQFIRFLIDRNEEGPSAAKIRSTFRAVSANKGYVTDLDLQRVRLPEQALSFLRRHMPQKAWHSDTEENVATFDHEKFLDQLLDS